MLLVRAIGISEVLVTPRYLVKTRRLHRQRLQQNAQETPEGTLILPHTGKAETEDEEDEHAEGPLIPNSESD